MKYLRYLLLILVFVMVPFIAYANTCDNADIKIQGLELVSKTGSTVQLNEAELVNNRISTDIKMYEVGDSIRYQFTVVNDSNDEYVLDRNSLILNNDTMDYKLESSDNSYIIDKNSSKNFTLTATYTNEVDASLFKGGKYEVGLDQIVEIKDPSLINPFTGNIFYYLIIIISIICIVFVAKGKKKHVLLVGLFGLLFVPFSTYALCTYSIDLEVGLKIGNIKPTYCTYDGEIAYGTEYVNGQFTYYYGKEYMFNIDYDEVWEDIGDGWSVQLTDKSSTDPVTTTLCTYINNIPVVSTSMMFYESHTSSIDTSSYNTSLITNMNSMFYLDYDNSYLSSLDVSNFDTSNVTDMFGMFCNCEYLTSLDVSNFDTSKVTNMTDMFNYCHALTSLDVSDFDTSKAFSLSGMFYGCSSIETIDISNFNYDSISKDYYGLSYMFAYCHSLTTVYFDNADFSNPIFYDESDYIFCDMFDGSSVENIYARNWKIPDAGFYRGLYSFGDLNDNLKTIDISGWDLSNTTNLGYMFYYFNSLESIVGLDTWDTSNISNMTHMFYYCKSLTSLDVSNFDTSNVTDMSLMFCCCYELVNFDVSNFDTSNVTNMEDMFSFIHNITNLDLRNFNTSNVVNMNSMFCGCESLTSLNVSSFDTSNVTDMDSMFSGCSALVSLNVSNFDTSNVTTMLWMFYKCYALKSIDVSNFDVSKVENMQSLFQDCTSLTSVNVSSFDVSNNPNLNSLFSGCTSLVTLDLSSFDFSDYLLGSLYHIIYNCSSLTTVYVRTEADISKINSSPGKPSNIQVVVKSV